MYVDSSPTQKRHTPRRESAPQNARHPKSVKAAARRIRAADAIVSQWLLEQLPADRRVRIAGTAS
jgi:hypothetical protein